ncbi:hypothetical protein [Shewanella sp. HN-41]|uniref:hypothetical protein n=1 Tax=Shewanella sp. HN-41 TaxID=327275 RepID=UPI0002125B24|nr:hypothetical protein [Shewanella sp. HN-41]EGM71104.1 hypothetical protein SOHN41_00838 [Shewanella sp. HN-41]
MEKSTQWRQEDGIGPIGWVAMLLCIALFIYEHFWGNGFTTMVVMLYCSFMLPSVLLTRRVQEKYFIYTLEYIKAFRKFTIFMSASFFCLWLLATYTPLIH